MTWDAHVSEAAQQMLPHLYGHVGGPAVTAGTGGRGGLGLGGGGAGEGGEGEGGGGLHGLAGVGGQAQYCFLVVTSW